MQLSHLKRVNNFEVERWLSEELELTPYQKSRMSDREIVRFSSFYFYKAAKEKSSLGWRLTLPFFLLYYILAVISLPFNFLITGKWGYGRDFYDKFHAPWVRKLGL